MKCLTVVYKVFPMRLRLLAGLFLISLNVSFDVVRRITLQDAHSLRNVTAMDVFDVQLQSASYTGLLRHENSSTYLVPTATAVDSRLSRATVPVSVDVDPIEVASRRQVEALLNRSSEATLPLVPIVPVPEPVQAEPQKEQRLEQTLNVTDSKNQSKPEISVQSNNASQGSDFESMRDRLTEEKQVNSTVPYIEPVSVSVLEVLQQTEQPNVTLPVLVKEYRSRGWDPTKYAYAFVIGGCNPDNGRYKGFLYNILVSARILREEGAEADIVAFFQISNSYNASELPLDDVRLLSSLGVKIMYIPKTELESFYDTVMYKFRILSLTQYKRVLLLDGDVMPIGNMDFLFGLSDGENATLKENVVVMGTQEPANGGFFMLAPGEGEYESILEIIRQREVEAASLDTWPKFDEVNGWGHVIDEDDKWEIRGGGGGTRWSFHFAFSDQGLLYHWTKFVKRSVSIIYGNGGQNQMVQNWAPSAVGNATLETRLNDPFEGLSKPRFRHFSSCSKFMCEFVHFTGSEKPWLKQPPFNSSLDDYQADDAFQVWWHTLTVLNDEFEIGLDFNRWEAAKPPLGLYATFHDVERRIVKRKKETNSTQVQTE